MNAEAKLKAAAKPRRGRPAGPAPHTEHTRAQFLDAAIRLFACHGYDAVSTGDIAKAVNLTQSMVHYHFGSKENIWRAAVTHLMRRRGPLFSPTRLAQAPKDPIAKLEMLIRNLAAANCAEPDYARIVMLESISNSERLDWLIDEFIRPGFKVFDDAIEEARQRSDIREISTHYLSNIVTSTVTLSFSLGPVMQKVYGLDVHSEEYLDALTSAITGVIFDGLRR
jgi:AcrR family transcriptional regulator